MEDFTQKLTEAFKEDNNPKNPKTTEELLELLPNVITHCIHSTQEIVYSPRVRSIYKNVPDEIKLIIICCLVLRKYEIDIYIVDMYLCEIGFINKNILKKNYTYSTTLLITPTYNDAFNLIKYGEPIWPNRYTSENIAPIFTIPAIHLSKNEVNSRINTLLNNKDKMLKHYNNDNKMKDIIDQDYKKYSWKIDSNENENENENENKNQDEQQEEVEEQEEDKGVDYWYDQIMSCDTGNQKCKKGKSKRVKKKKKSKKKKLKKNTELPTSKTPTIDIDTFNPNEIKSFLKSRWDDVIIHEEIKRISDILDYFYY